MTEAPIYDRAVAIRDELRAALDATDDLGGVHVTLNPLDVPKAADRGVVCVSPPELDLETFTQTAATWEITVVSGHMQDIDAAWQRADRIINAIRTTTLAVDKAIPGSYTPPGNSGRVLTAYVLTLEETYIHTEE